MNEVTVVLVPTSIQSNNKTAMKKALEIKHRRNDAPDWNEELNWLGTGLHQYDGCMKNYKLNLLPRAWNTLGLFCVCREFKTDVSIMVLL